VIGHHSSPDPGHKPHQAVLNVSWPLRDEKGPHARHIRDSGRIPVTARLVFEDDGPTWVDCTAVRWHGTHVCVYVHDDRLQVPYVWLAAADVKPV
jgi:hypothetical protein